MEVLPVKRSQGEINKQLIADEYFSIQGASIQSGVHGWNGLGPEALNPVLDCELRPIHAKLCVSEGTRCDLGYDRGDPLERQSDTSHVGELMPSCPSR